MKLIKINTDHYVLTDDSEIRIGDIVAEKLLTGKYELFTIHTLNDIDKSTQKKIAYSTQPESLGTGWMQSVLPLLLSEVKEFFGVVDVEKKAEKFIGCEYVDIEDSIDQIGYDSFIRGYNQALEDNKDKKYTEEDLRRAYMVGKHGGVTQTYYEFDEYIQQLQPKTEWDVEMVDGKLKLI